MDQNNKYHLAYTLRSLAGGFFFMFLASFVIGDDAFNPWWALAVSSVCFIVGSLLKASADINKILDKYKN